MKCFRYISIFFFCCLLGTACNENTNKLDIDIEQGFEYFPLIVGKYLVYEVDSIVYDTTGMGVVIDTNSLWVREEVVDSFADNTGRTAFRIERSTRYSEEDPWVVRDIWMSVRTDDRAERVEENLRFIKLVFPMIEGTVWNGNLFIDETTVINVAGESLEMFKNWSYELESLNVSEQIGDLQFEEVATVIQADSENLIELRYSVEKYARNVGLVYRELKILDTQQITETQSWEQKAQKGFILRQQLVDYN